MSDKYAKMTTRQTDLGRTDAGRAPSHAGWSNALARRSTPTALLVGNHALARGFVFHTAADVAIPVELSPAHNRGLWQTDEQPLPDVAPDQWRLLSGRGVAGQLSRQRRKRMAH